MKRYTIPALIIFYLLLIGIPIHADAQAPATSFEELRSSFKLQPGQSIEITDDAGRHFKARLAEISSRSLGVVVDGQRRDIQESAVREIRQRRPDKWWNGMLIGLGAGAATGFGIAATTCGNDSECRFYATLVAVPVSAGIGAGAGALIDFAIKKHDTIFARPGAAGRGLTISPILSPDKKGVKLAFSF
jgi:hypothetical protein